MRKIWKTRLNVGLIAQLDSFYLNLSEPNRSCLQALRYLILNFDSDISESQKYGMPCFSYNKKLICYLWIDKKTKEPYILVVQGKRIDHQALEQGNRAKMKILSVNPNADLPVRTINEILELALALSR